MSGNLWFKSGLDNTQLKRDVDQAKTHITGLSDKVKLESSKMDSSFSQASKALAAIGGTAAITMLGKQILDTTAKFEKFGIVLKNSLGEIQGQQALDMITQFAATTPFQLDEVTGAFIKMANQGFVPTQSEMVKLGDLASSVGKGFDQLAEAIIDAQTGEMERLKEFGIKAAQNGDKVTFTFKEQKTTVENTASAIRAYVLSLGDMQGIAGANAKISESLTGELSNLEDKLASMYNTIGTANKGILYDAVGGVSTLVDNYELVGKVLVGLVATYGAYKTAVILATAVTEGYTIAQKLELTWLLAVEAAQKALNKTMLLNPYVAAAVAITALVSALAIYVSMQNKATDENKAFSDAQKVISENYGKEEAKIKSLTSTLNNEKLSWNQRHDALLKIQELAPNYHANLTKEGELINNNKSAIDDYLKSLEKKIKVEAYQDELVKLTKAKILQEGILRMNMKRQGIKTTHLELGKGEVETSTDDLIRQNPNLKGAEGYKNTLEQIDKISKEIDSSFDKITPKTIKNFDFWTKQKKNAEDALHAMSDSEKGSKGWNKQLSLLNEADTHLKNYDTSGKLKNSQTTALDDAKKLQIKNQRELEDLANENEQSRIDNMDESFSKEMAQLKLNHEKKLLTIKRQEEDLLAEFRDQKEKEWIAKGGKKENFKPESIQLPASTTEQYDNAVSLENTGYTKSQNDLLKDLLKQYQDYSTQKSEIDKKYQDNFNVLNDIATNKDGKQTAESIENAKKAIVELEKQKEQSINNLNIKEVDTITQTNGVFISLFSDMSDKSISDLEKVLDESKKLYNYLKNTKPEDITVPVVFGGKTYTPEQIKLMQKDPQFMKGLKNATTNGDDLVKGVKGGSNDLVDAFKAVDDYNKSSEHSVNDQLELQKKLQAGYSTLSGYVGQAQGLLSAISTQEGDTADQAAKSVGAVMKIADATVTPLLKGDYIGAAIGFVTSTLTQIFESEKAHQEALIKLQDEKTAQQKEYNDLLMKQNELLDNAETIFGTDAFGQAQGYAQVADKLRTASQTSTNALKNASVQTGSHKGGLFGWGGEVADYSGLLATYPKLIDGQGNLNKELAQSILDNQNLDETSKKALQSALDYSKDYEDALKSLGDYLNSVFGSLGQDMMTAITDNLNSSQDALDAFGQSASKTIEKMLNDIAYSLFFADKFNEMSDKYKAIMADNSLTPEQQAAKETKLMGDFYSSIGDDVEAAQAWLKQNQDLASQAGLDLYDQTRTASSKGIATASQESVDENNGRLTAIQGHTFRLAEGMDILKANSAQALKHLSGIETNTSRLEAVENGINSIKQGISDINTKGIFIKA